MKRTKGQTFKKHGIYFYFSKTSLMLTVFMGQSWYCFWSGQVVLAGLSACLRWCQVNSTRLRLPVWELSRQSSLCVHLSFSVFCLMFLDAPWSFLSSRKLSPELWHMQNMSKPFPLSQFNLIWCLVEQDFFNRIKCNTQNVSSAETHLVSSQRCAFRRLNIWSDHFEMIGRKTKRFKEWRKTVKNRLNES